MSFSLPNPTVPTNGQPGDATPILQNELALAQAIASFDGSQIQSGTIQNAAFAASVSPQTRGAETFVNFVFSGCVWALVSGLSGTMTGGTIYVNGIRTVVSGVGANTFAASSDTYVYIDSLGNVTYSAVSNNASSPSATPNAILVAIVITNGSTITSVNQGSATATAPVVSSVTLTVSDSSGNLIYPTNPSPGIIGHRQIITSQTSTSASGTQISGLSLAVIVPPTKKAKVTVYSFGVVNSLASGNYGLQIWDGPPGSGTQIQASQLNNNTGGGTSANLTLPVTMVTPPLSVTGLKTYNVGGFTSTGTMTMQAAALSPAIILVEAV